MVEPGIGVPRMAISDCGPDGSYVRAAFDHELEIDQLA
jgi:hypothetical protein